METSRRCSSVNVALGHLFKVTSFLHEFVLWAGFMHKVFDESSVVRDQANNRLDLGDCEC